MPRCSIIIPVYNRAALTQQCVNTILETPPLSGDFEIVVVDDASTDNTPDLLQSYGPRLHSITHQTNSGFASACNEGALAAAGDFLVFLNNDTRPQPGWLDALVHYALDHPQAAVIGSKLLYANDTVQHAGVVVDQNRWPRHIYAGFPAAHPAVNKSRRFQIVTAACALFRREPFVQAEGFDRAFVNSMEDVDLCLRLGACGHEIHYCHESVLYHLESVSPRKKPQDERNGELYWERWGAHLQPDDVQYYLEDGLLKIDYPNMSYSGFYPVHFTISPLLGVVEAEARMQPADHLLAVRARQAFDLLRENVRLELRLQEKGIRREGGA